MIKISASLIKDYLSCSQRAFYRLYEPQESIETEYMAMGTVVHNAIEKYWDNYERAFEYVNEQLELLNLPEDLDTRRVGLSLKNFFNTFTPFLTDMDKIEEYFKIPFKKGVYLTGKLDRVTWDGIIFDWKTSFKVPDSIDNDIQFIMYHYAYRKLYGKLPEKVYYVSLPKNKMVEFIPRKEYLNHFEQVLIPNIVEAIKKKMFVREGLYTGACDNCQFQTVCFKELLCQDGM